MPRRGRDCTNQNVITKNYISWEYKSGLGQFSPSVSVNFMGVYCVIWNK